MRRRFTLSLGKPTLTEYFDFITARMPRQVGFVGYTEKRTSPPTRLKDVNMIASLIKI